MGLPSTVAAGSLGFTRDGLINRAGPVSEESGCRAASHVRSPTLFIRHRPARATPERGTWAAPKSSIVICVYDVPCAEAGLPSVPGAMSEAGEAQSVTAPGPVPLGRGSRLRRPQVMTDGSVRPVCRSISASERDSAMRSRRASPVSMSSFSPSKRSM